MDPDDIKNRDLYDLFWEWCRNEVYTKELSPYFADFGDVNREEMNMEIFNLLNRYLSN
jgi:hypothetical protein